MRYLLAVCTVLAGASLLACGGGAKPSSTLTPNVTASVAPTATLAAPTVALEAAAAIVAIRADLATRVSEVEVQDMDVISITRRDWPDSWLGLPRPTEQCAEVITPGYEIWLGLPLGSTYVYRVSQAPRTCGSRGSFRKGRQPPA